jgi:hypothetical protein
MTCRRDDQSWVRLGGRIDKQSVCLKERRRRREYVGAFGSLALQLRHHADTPTRRYADTPSLQGRRGERKRRFKISTTVENAMAK